MYIAVLRIMSPEKFKNIISSIQIIFAVLVYASYQLLPRLIDKAEMKNFQLSDNPFLLLAPPYWFANAFSAVITMKASGFEMIAAAFAVILPVVCIYVVIKHLAPSFNQKISMISGSDGNTNNKTEKLIHEKTGFRLQKK